MNPSSGPLVDDTLRKLAQEEAAAMARELGDIRAVVIATGDGFEIASSVRGDIEAERIAALASSIAAIGAVVSTEAKLGTSTGIMVMTDRGFAVVHAATHRGMDLVIHVIAGADALLAQVNYRVAAAARALSAA